jgi:hypothetical protein
MRPYTIEGDTPTISDIPIKLDVPGAWDRYGTNDDIVFMRKGTGHINAYADLANRFGVPRALIEVGVSRGGSSVFFSELFDEPQMACIELSQSEAAKPVIEYFRSHPRIGVHFGVDQSDRSAVLDAARRMGESPDWVIDDASHLYELSRITFETLFPLVRNGGIYILEDWSWSHQPAAQTAGHFFEGMSALTNLVFDLTTACGTRSDIFSELHLEPAFCWLRRGPGQLPRDGSFRRNDYLALRGRRMELI